MLNVVFTAEDRLRRLGLRRSARSSVVAFSNRLRFPYPMDPGLMVRVRFWPS